MQQRARTLHPSMFLDVTLAEAERLTGLPLRVAYLGLHTCADREGRFPWDPKALKALVLPYDDDVDFDRVLEALKTCGVIVHYSIGLDASASRGHASDGTSGVGALISWGFTQTINNRERASVLPGPKDSGSIVHPLQPLHNPTPPKTRSQGEKKKEEEPRAVEPDASAGLFGDGAVGRTKKKPELPKRIQDLVDLWNRETAGSPLPSCLAATGQRFRDLDIATREEPDLAVWREAIRALLVSPHHVGQNERGWKADIGFLVQPSQRSKWLEKGRAAVARVVRVGSGAPMDAVEEAFAEMDRGRDFDAWLTRQVILPPAYRGRDPRLTDILSPRQVVAAEAELRAWWQANIAGKEAL